MGGARRAALGPIGDVALCGMRPVMLQVMSGFWTSGWYPPVGVSIAIVALLSIFAPDRLGRYGKPIWVLVVLLLITSEIRSIAREQRENQTKFEDTMTALTRIIYDSTGDGSYIY